MTENRPVRKRRAEMTEDSPEQIALCLNCKRSKCTNCLHGVQGTETRKPKGNPVIAFGNGEERRFDSTREAGRAMNISPENIRQAIRRGGKSYGYYWRYDDGN